MTPADLKAALTGAKRGSKVQVPPGRYGQQKFFNLKGVEIEFAPGAQLDTYSMQNCTDVALRGGLFELPSALATMTGVKIVTLAACHGCEVSGATIHGAIATLGDPEDADPATSSHLINGRPAGFGLALDMACSNLSIFNNDISRCFKAVAASNLGFSRVFKNLLHDNRASGFVGGCHDTEISYNHIWNFRPWKLGAGDHNEGIHVFSAPGGTKADSANVKVIWNLIEQGAGDPIVIAASLEPGNDFGFTDYVMRWNTVINSSGQGLQAFKSTGAMSDNTLLQQSGDWTQAPSFRFVGTKERRLLPAGTEFQRNTGHDLYGVMAAAAQAEALGLPPMVNTILPKGVVTPANVILAARNKALAAIAAATL